MNIENFVLIGGILLFISVILSKTSFRMGVPVLIFFLGIGMLAGSEGIGGIHFDNNHTAQFIGIIALNFILFYGGFDTKWSSIKPILWRGVSLSTLGVLLTALFLGICVHWLTDFTFVESMLLGSIVSSTDAAAVFSVLRTKKKGLKNHLKPLLELESGSNDPMAYLLTIIFMSLVKTPDASLWVLVPIFFKQILFGVALGLIMGFIGAKIINSVKLEYEAFYPLLAMALMFVTFGMSNLIGGNGFLSIYLCAMYIGSQKIAHRRSIDTVFDGVTWLMQICVFITLGLLAFPSKIIPYAGIGLLVSACLMFVVRPLSVFISLIPFKMPFKARVFTSWVGLKGAVPIVLATYPLAAGLPNSEAIFNIVFFVSVTSVLVQGTSFSKIADWFGLSMPVPLEDKKCITDNKN